MRRSTRLKTALTAVPLVAAVALTASPAQADTVETLTVEFADRTGDFRGGATGTLYGFGDDGVPTQALVNGARVTNTSQMPPDGAQHPSGDALNIESTFFDKHGQDLYVYMQDYYPDWPYNGGERVGDERSYDTETGEYAEEPNGVWDYLEVVEYVTTRIAREAESPERFVFKPFNEPDGIWYQNWGAMRETFEEDWLAVHTAIHDVYQEHGLDPPRIAGTGDTGWQPQRTRDFLGFAVENDVVPDVFIWHELGIDNLGSFRSHLAEYRTIEEEQGIEPRPVNITEYGMLRDMAVPGQLIQWFSLFEDAKVDAQTAYWNYAGNFSDNSARPNGANGGWWMFKWYGDLAGSETVRVRPPVLNVPDTLQGIGAVDETETRATVLYGGSGADAVRVDLRDLDPAVFGSHVDVEVREVQLNGAEGLTGTPRVVHTERAVELRDSLPVDVPNTDRYSGYQVLVTPARDGSGMTDQPWQTSIEAEDTELTDAQVYNQPPTAEGGWKFLASGGRDVGSFNQPTSRAEWTVDVPRDGLYRLQVIGATPGVPGQHALYVDDAFETIVQYTANLAHSDTSRWQYRGSAEVLVPLEEGEHTLSLRGSRDGEELPNIDITLDKLVLTDVTEGETVGYPAAHLRLESGAEPVYDEPWARGFVHLAGEARAEAYLSAMEGGYYDVAVRYRSGGPTSVDVSVNGRQVTTMRAEASGSWQSTARLHLSEGINEVELSSPEGALIEGVTTTRAREADEATVKIEAEDAVLGGEAEVVTPEEAGSNASGQYVADLGNGTENTLALSRQDGFDQPGSYDLVVAYANAEVVGDHSYNPQVVDRRLQVHEAGEEAGYAYFRYTHHWESFQLRTVPLELRTSDAELVLGDEGHWAPHVDYVVVAPSVLGTPETVALPEDPEPRLDAVQDEAGDELGPEDPVEPGRQVTVLAEDFAPLQQWPVSVGGGGDAISSASTASGTAVIRQAVDERAEDPEADGPVTVLVDDQEPAVGSDPQGRVVAEVAIPADAPDGPLEITIGSLEVTVLVASEDGASEDPPGTTPDEDSTQDPGTTPPGADPDGTGEDEGAGAGDARPDRDLALTGADVAVILLIALLLLVSGTVLALRRARP